MILYMDLCCFNRPFDDQLQQKIYLETEAKLFIQKKVKDGEYDLVWSYMLDYENSVNPDEETRNSIQKWENVAIKIILENHSITSIAAGLIKSGFGIKDSLHIACAINAQARYFITVDKGILKKKNMAEEIIIINPLEFISQENEI
ncbi:MAG TPA: PIN domain protein [Spirochaetota bacterium]|nr:PIN domain protein [Spirochaetota bacterium]